MSDLISKRFIQEALIEKISNLNAEGATQTARELTRLKRFVDGLAPSADRPEIVYCKDCRHKFTCGMKVQYIKQEQNSITIGSYMVDYCSHGERKEQSDDERGSDISS